MPSNHSGHRNGVGLGSRNERQPETTRRTHRLPEAYSFEYNVVNGALSPKHSQHRAVQPDNNTLVCVRTIPYPPKGQA